MLEFQSLLPHLCLDQIIDPIHIIFSLNLSEYFHLIDSFLQKIILVYAFFTFSSENLKGFISFSSILLFSIYDALSIETPLGILFKHYSSPVNHLV